MRLDVRSFRFLGKDDFRVLAALETASRNHETVPVSMLASLTRFDVGFVHDICGNLIRFRLIRKSQKAPGYILGFGGLDYLAVNALCARGSLSGVGSRIGVGKESDIHQVEGPDGVLVLKLHRLGRTSFRRVKLTRDYHRHRTHVSWLCLSRLAAQKEYAFLQALYENGFPVPTPVDWNRHAILMKKIDGVQLSQAYVENPAEMCGELLSLIERFANYGLIHCDFNEFNCMVEENRAVVIDFPQMVSVRHPNARFLFDRDVDSIRSFFRKKYLYEPLAVPDLDSCIDASYADLGILLKASGFTSQMETSLQKALCEGEESNPETSEDSESEDEVEELVSLGKPILSDEEVLF